MARKRTSDKASPHSRLSPEDAALWERVARSATPLSRPRVQPGRQEPAAPEAPVAASRAKPGRKHEPVQPARPEPTKTPPVQYDRREAKRLAAGRVEIDARIDLHGLRQREAHRVLDAFLANAHARGHRHVLVITGKGRSRAPEAPGSFINETVEPGVLRRALPQWLEGGSLRAIVVGYAQAGPRHGGEGAFYVRLRKAGR